MIRISIRCITKKSTFAVSLSILRKRSPFETYEEQKMKTTILSVICMLYSLCTADAMNILPHTSTNHSLDPSRITTNLPHKKRSPFSKEEDNRLKQLVEQYIKKHGEEKTGMWKDIAAQMENRNTRQCRERWRHSLSGTNSQKPWTQEEDELLLEKYREFGPKWIRIAKHLKRGLSETKTRLFKLSHKTNLHTAITALTLFVNFPLAPFNFPAVCPISLPKNQPHLQTTPTENQRGIQCNTLLNTPNQSSDSWTPSTVPLDLNIDNQTTPQTHQANFSTTLNSDQDELKESIFGNLDWDDPFLF